MLTLVDQPSSRFCDGIHRRNFIRIGATAVAGLTLAELKAREAVGDIDSSERSLVLVYLPGGPTQHETFDPKRHAPAEIRGSFDSISTAVPGEHFCELLPQLAAMSDTFSVVRSLVGMKNRHESFQCYTGRPGGRQEDSEPSGGWPSIGSVVSKVLGRGPNGMVPFIDAAPKMGHRPYNNLGFHDPAAKRSWPGFTGPQHAPFTMEGDGKGDLVLNGIDLTRLDHRKALLTALSRSQDVQQSVLQSDPFREQAFGILTSSRLSDAMNLELEPQAVRDRYGALQNTDPSFGGAPQDPARFLLARRLIEAGVRCVTIAFGAWDWHANREGTIEYLSNKYLPVFDRTMAVFLQDLKERGLLDRTTVMTIGEFGRTPRINAKGGRDHWPNTQSILLAGGGIQGGRIVGQTDPTGGVPAERPVHIQEVFATLYRNMGIDANGVKISDLTGRPRYLVDDNCQPLSELY